MQKDFLSLAFTSAIWFVRLLSIAGLIISIYENKFISTIICLISAIAFFIVSDDLYKEEEK